MYPLISAILWLLITVLDIYLAIIIAAVITSWLITFNVINTRHPFVQRAVDVLQKLTEPPLSKIRKVIPAIGGLDFSPLILILAIIFVQRLIIYYWPTAIY